MTNNVQRSTPNAQRPLYDLAIIGSGFGGSLLAMVARRLGRSVLLLERGSHPRFAIGESTSPLMNLLIEELAKRYDLPRLLPLTTYGTWQRAYPEVVCGLKRGFSYFPHEPGKPYQAEADRSNQLLVAASPNNELSDTHWLRSSVDHFLQREAVAAGVDYHDEVHLAGVAWPDAETAVLTGMQRGEPFESRARLVIDATGPRGFLSRALSLQETTFAGYPPTQTLFSHFTNVRRCESMPAFHPPGEIDTAPFPMDDAALHHVFDGGWMWVLRFNNDITSAGFAVVDALAEELRLSEGEPAWQRFLARYPTIGEQFARAEATVPFAYSPRLPYRAAAATGPGWAMLPSAAAFIDPLFSTGMPLTLLGIERLGRILEEAWDSSDLNDRLQSYGEMTLAEVDATADFVSACYAGFADFDLFRSFSMFYFAAASFSEMARRLEKRHLVRRYLASDRADYFGSLRCCAGSLRAHLASGTGAAANFEAEVGRGIAPLNVAGLSDPTKRNWYGVDLEDLVHNSKKLELTPEEMRRILATAEWAQIG